MSCQDNLDLSGFAWGHNYFGALFSWGPRFIYKNQYYCLPLSSEANYFSATKFDCQLGYKCPHKSLRRMIKHYMEGATPLSREVLCRPCGSLRAPIVQQWRWSVGLTTGTL